MIKDLTLMAATLLLFALGATAQISDSILYIGRFDHTKQDTVVYSHLSSTIMANFSGTGISATFASLEKSSYLYIIIDGNADPLNRNIIEVKSANFESFVLADNLEEGNHTIEIVKTNQYDSKLAFIGFEVNGGTLLEKPAKKEFLIDFYGDSNPAGHSAWDAKDGGHASTNGGYYTYPGMVASMLNADYYNITMGGIGITDDAWRNIYDYHNRIHFEQATTPENKWMYQDMADVVVINVGANDYYAGATKESIKAGWHDFIKKKIRTYYPDAHIVLANSYGWAKNEPADYVHETVDEFIAAGDTNISYVLFPWLWGQEHAVVNEHAGFANILAQHIAEQFNLSEPELNKLSSFAPYGEINNGSFEKSTLPGVADGWRPNGNVTRVKNAMEAYDGENYLKLYNRAWSNYANDGKAGEIYTVKGWMKGIENGNLGKLKLEFKDQGQNTLHAVEGLQELSTDWQEFETVAQAPEGTWAVWVVLVAESGDSVCFDNIEFELGGTLPTKINETEQGFRVYPNPSNGEYICIENVSGEDSFVKIISFDGRLIDSKIICSEDKQISFSRKLNPGAYIAKINTLKSSGSKIFIVD